MKIMYLHPGHLSKLPAVVVEEMGVQVHLLAINPPGEKFSQAVCNWRIYSFSQRRDYAIGDADEQSMLTIL